MKRFLIVIMFLLATPVFAQYQVIEQECFYETKITLCAFKGESFVLITNGYDLVGEYLLIYSGSEYSARQAYGEILLKYYHIKNLKKDYKTFDGKRYHTTEDNSEELVAYLRSLTDYFVLQDYDSFAFIDENNSNDLVLDDEEVIGTAAGYFMVISADDFINFLEG